MDTDIDALAMIAMPESKFSSISASTLEECSHQAKQIMHCSCRFNFRAHTPLITQSVPAACQAGVFKQLKLLFSSPDLPLYFARQSSGKAKKGGRSSKKIHLDSRKLKNVDAVNQLFHNAQFGCKEAELRSIINAEEGQCPLHTDQAWLTDPAAAFARLTFEQRQFVCSIDMKGLTRILDKHKQALDGCGDCSKQLNDLCSIISGTHSAQSALGARYRELQPEIFASLALGPCFPSFPEQSVCAACPAEWRAPKSSVQPSKGGSLPLSAQPWLASHRGLDDSGQVCEQHKPQVPFFPKLQSTLYVNPGHALCLMLQAVRTAGRRAGQTPKHTHSVKAAQCCLLEVVGVLLLGRLECAVRATQAREHYIRVATAAIVQTCFIKLRQHLAAENQKKAQQAIRAAERAAAQQAAKASAKATAAGAAGHASDGTDSDSEDDFLAAHSDIYLKVAPRNMQAVAQQVASGSLPPAADHSESSSSQWRPQSRTDADSTASEQDWQHVQPASTRVAPDAPTVPAVSGWSLQPEQPLIAPAVSHGFGVAPAPSFADEAALHSGLSLPATQGAAVDGFVPLSTAFSAPASTATLPGSFLSTTTNMQSPLFGDTGVLGLGSMGATSASSLAVNSALFAQAEHAHAEAAKLSTQARQWAVSDE